MKLILISWYILTHKTTGIGGSENPYALIQLQHYDQKIGIWCAISTNSIIGPIFYEETLDVE
jgi:hypothetical protein